MSLRGADWQKACWYGVTTGLCAALLTQGAGGCQRWTGREQPREIQAKFGVFFGSEIQDRRVLARPKGVSRETVGFRLALSPALTRAGTLRWQLELPGPRRASGALSPRVERHGTALLASGSDRYDQTLPLELTDPEGTYNLRLWLDETVILERPFRVDANLANPN